MTDTHFEEIPLSRIDLGDRFRGNYGNLKELAESIKDKGVIQPISVRAVADGRYLLLAGARRYKASEMAGEKTIPAVVRTFEGDAELDLREIELIENVQRKDLAWNERALLEERVYKLKGSQRATAEALDESVGAVNRRLQLASAIKIIPELAECKTEDEAWKKLIKIQENMTLAELRKRVEEEAAAAMEAEEEDEGDTSPTSSLTKIFRWADNHYKIGDALEEMPTLPAAVWDFAEVDPPYAIDLHNKKRGDKVDKEYKEVSPEEYEEFITRAAEETYRMMKNPSFTVWWFGPEWQEVVRRALKEARFSVSTIPAIWYKGKQGQTSDPDTVLASCYEPFFLCRKGRPAIRQEGRSNVFEYKPVPHQHKIHPTERPIDLILELLDTFVYPGQSVLSPFLGSGKTLMACYMRELTCMGWDISSQHKDRFIVKVHEDLGEVES